MMYLKMISSKLSDDKDIQEIIKNMETDEEVIEFLKSKGYDYGKVIKTLEKYYGFNYIDLKNVEVDYDLLSKFDLNKLEKNLVFPYKYEEVGNKCFFAINDITNQNIIKNIKEACKSVNLIPVFNFSFDFEITHIYTVVHSKVNIIENSTDFNAQNWVSSIIDEGILRGASDIHIENLENCLQVRYRIDGVLTNIKEFNFSETTISSICVRIKIISAMDIAEKRKPQDGRIDNYEFIGSKYDIRVSSIRTIFGEKFVMRLIEKSSDTKTFEQLGFNNENEEKIKRMLANQNGIVYLAGATGSGKTTTLYTMIEHINNSDINIYTIENPVEKTINKVNQIQINPMAGIDYPSILKSLLRQDPDVIVVGEIRDNETASLSVRASLTGHLVLTTIHANNAIDSISRLFDMDIEPYLLSASTIGFLSQRLPRTLCPHCMKKVDKLKPYERVWLDKICEEYNLPHYEDSHFYKADGCEHCSNGYKGRIAVVEIIEVSDNLRSLISKPADLNTIKENILQEGFKPLAVDGVEKALNGITTIDELIRHLN